MMLTLGPDEHNETKAGQEVKEPEAQKPNRAQQRFHADFMDRAARGYGHRPMLMTTSWTMTIPAPPDLTGSISRSCWLALATNGSD